MCVQKMEMFMDREQPSEVERLNWTPLGMREYKDAVYVPRFVREQHYDALAARLAEAERERDEWHARAIALFWKGDADGATVGHVRSATAAVKQLLAQDRATDSAPTSPKGNPCLTPDDCLRAADGTECWPCDHATPDSASAVQPERCCLDYPRCDCNSPPEPDNAPTLQPCGHPWEAQHDFKCILCSSPGDATYAQLAEEQRFLHGAPAEWPTREEAEKRAAELMAIGLYNELLYAVASKYPGESRHDTALRYIRDRETRASNGPSQPVEPKP